ncbi:MipA/OmpV family protein [Leptothrix ochracea]|jgi:outer membrane protein|uniref:MipA/OmpV family protein n=1 Tax=Leptothrix ochracea TaxID=735331 RepID=UPI0034E2871D
MKRLLWMSLVVAATGAQAQSMSPLYQLGPRPQTDRFSMGFIAASTPIYPGTTERSFIWVPSFDAQWANGWFASVSYGLGYNVAEGDSEYGARLIIDLGRSANQNEVLAGLGSVRPSLNPALFANWAATPWLKFFSGVRYDVGEGGTGFAADAGARMGLYLSPRGDVGLALMTEGQWANASYNQSYYGVTADQASHSVYFPYEPGAGQTETRMGLVGFWAPDARLNVTWRLMGIHPGATVQNSPLVEHATALSGTVMLSYRWR